jgi:hypothetical protein
VAHVVGGLDHVVVWLQGHGVVKDTCP